MRKQRLGESLVQNNTATLRDFGNNIHHYTDENIWGQGPVQRGPDAILDKGIPNADRGDSSWAGGLKSSEYPIGITSADLWFLTVVGELNQGWTGSRAQGSKG